MELEKYDLSIEENQETSIKDILMKYLIHWKWFVISVIISILVGRYYLKSQTPLYEVNASILIKDDQKGELSELSAFEDLSLLRKSKNIDNEIEILKSRSLMMRVVKKLNLNITYFIKQRHLESELYCKAPFKMTFVGNDSSFINKYGSYYLIFDSKEHFILMNNDKEELGQYNLNQIIKTEVGAFIISLTKEFSDWFLGKEMHVNVAPIISVADSYRSAIQINTINKSSSVLILTLQDPSIEKASDIINNIIKLHNNDAIADKNLVSRNTANFINDRISFITDELSSVEREVENFKTKHEIINIESEAKMVLENENESKMKILEINTQIQIVDFILEYLRKQAALEDLIPTNIGITDASVSSQITDFNNLILYRNRLLKNSSDKNPVILNINNQLIGLKFSIIESLNNFRNTVQIKLKEINKKDNDITLKIGNAPKNEKEFRIIQRQQQIKEGLYLYLLQKREETNIALAVTIANAKVIDQAYSNGVMIAPKRKSIYMSSLFIGLIIPIIVLIVLDLLDSKVHSKKDIDRIGIPYLGDIPHSSSKNKLVAIANDSSNISEGFRLLRTNVEFINNPRKNSSKTVFVTSTIGKEGKSFIALNLAASFALLGKKTLLIGADLRAPKILTYLNLDKKKGLTNYITDETMKLNELIFNVPDIKNFDVLCSGPIPSNPDELLMHPRIKEMFETVKSQYDYVIVDTAPVGLVADTLLINMYADCTVFVARANYLDKRLLRIAETLNREKRLPKMTILINGSDFRKGYGYGYGYGGYGYGNNKPKPWWKKIFTRVTTA